MSLGRIYTAVRALPKSLRFNLKYFPFREAIRLPVWVSHRVWLKRMEGRVVVDAPRERLKSGLVRIGFSDVGIFDRERSRTIWEVTGEVVFRGTAVIGHGSKISVSGTLVVGASFTVTAESAIVCRKHIQIGEGCLISWDVLIMDTDFHKIYDERGQRLNEDAPIAIGARVWIGCRSLILKGVEIADGSIIAAATTLTRSVAVPNRVIAGNGDRVLAENVRWDP